MGATRAPEIAQKDTGKATHAELRVVSGASILGVGRAIPGVSILGTPGVPEIAQEDTAKAQFNREQLDTAEAGRWLLLLLKQQERASTEAAAQALRVASKAELMEENEEAKRRQDWEAAAVKAIQAKWQKVGSANGEARGWRRQMVRSIKTRCRTSLAWSRMATAVKAKNRSARLTAAYNDRQHRQRQLSKQREPKQGKARKLQGQEADHAKRREAAEAETNAEEEAWALALEEKAKPEAAERIDKGEMRRLAKHKAKREGCVTLWRKAEKDAARKTAKQLQARIRQLASETAATFEFEVGQAAEIADGKSRYRLNRVFSTKQLESPEETVRRYWRRAAEQPQVREFVKGETRGIDKALERLRVNVRYRIERQPETIETSWQELRAVLQDRIQSLVSAMECGNIDTVKEMLGDVMYTMCAARDDDSDRSGSVAALSMWDEIMFHAVKVGVTFEGMQKEEEVVADTGAAPLLVSETRLSVEVMKQSLVPGRARVMHSASSHRVKTKGGAVLNFRLSGCRQRFSHEWQVTEGATTPTILGVSFWAKYKAQFDFKDRVIRMTVDGTEVSVPFTIGDEASVAKEYTRRERGAAVCAGGHGGTARSRLHGTGQTSERA